MAGRGKAAPSHGFFLAVVTGLTITGKRTQLGPRPSLPRRASCTWTTTVSSRVVHTPWRGREPLLARGSIAGGFRTSGVIVCRSGRIGDDVKYPHAKANPEAHDRGYRRSLITSSGRAPVRDRARPVKTRPWSCPPPSTAARPSGRCGQQFPQQGKPCLRHDPA